MSSILKTEVVPFKISLAEFMNLDVDLGHGFDLFKLILIMQWSKYLTQYQHYPLHNQEDITCEAQPYVIIIC